MNFVKTQRVNQYSKLFLFFTSVFDNLVSIDYSFSFSLEQQKFAYTMKNLGIYSDVIDISIKEEIVKFCEKGEIGEGEFIWKKEHLLSFKYTEEECTSAHSLAFLLWVDKMTQVLSKSDPIRFNIKTDHPIRIETNFLQLGNSSLLFFLAPRIPEAEFSDDDEDMDDF